MTVSEGDAPKTEVKEPASSGEPAPTIMQSVNKLDLLNDISILLTVEIGRVQIKIRDLLELKPDSIIELDKAAGEPVDLYANGRLIAKGHIIMANEKYCIRLISINEEHPLGAQANVK